MVLSLLENKCLVELIIFDNQKQIEIELLFLPKGFYIVDCLLQNGRINHKFIIE